MKAYFEQDLIEEVFEVDEVAFDAVRLREMLAARLAQRGVDVRLNCDVQRLGAGPGGRGIAVQLAGGETLTAERVFNCTYSQINTLLARSDLPLMPLKHEVAEICLVRPPAEIAGLGVTVIDGPFFSTMPFPAERLHSLSHVRYTPRDAWFDRDGYRNAYQFLESMRPETHYLQMIRDAERYLPVLERAVYVRSLFEVKTVLTQNEVNDGRPILLVRDHGLTGFHVVMGGKVDNIYDIFQSLADMRRTGNAGDAPPVDEDLFRRLFG